MGSRALVVGNWKMNGQKARVEALVHSLREGLAEASQDAEVVLCPPFVYLDMLQRLCAGSELGLGAQNLNAEDAGAFTGEISAPMLGEFGCRYVLVGHSERRQFYAEDDAVVVAKFAAAQRHGLVPILCVGESAEQRAAGATEAVVAGQIEAVLRHCGSSAFGAAVVAYEPVWAIGSGQAATPEQAQAVHAFIRGILAAHDAMVADMLRILYGGSVNAANAGEFYRQPDVDGALVGGASLQAEEFLAICGSLAGLCRAGHARAACQN